MNNISYGQATSTFSYALLAAGLLTSLQMPTKLEIAVERKVLFHSLYAAGGNKPTFNTFGSPVSGSYELTTNELEQAVGNFYVRLLASQEPLGAEFEKVLYANLWDLYES